MFFLLTFKYLRTFIFGDFREPNLFHLEKPQKILGE